MTDAITERVGSTSAAPSAGLRLATALAAKDRAGMLDALAPDVDFRALTPGRPWRALTADDAVDVFLGSWFEPHDDIVEVLSMEESEPVEDTAHVSYRFALSTPTGPRTSEQQAYYRVDEDGRIAHLRVMCSGFRPVGEPRSASPTPAP